MKRFNSLKGFIAPVALTLALVVGFIIGTQYNTSTNASGNGKGVYPIKKTTGEFSVNENGYTYGSSSGCVQPEDYPDLIWVEATNKKSGYVYFNDYYDVPPESPEAASKYMEEREKRIARGDKVSRVMPVYELNGITVIGEYEIVFSDSFVGTEDEINAHISAIAEKNTNS
jgi:hypothetical protein